ncbi:MAG: hypothetical protein WBK96_10410 [Candidatus Manganitrophaceae bacterium]
MRLLDPGPDRGDDLDTEEEEDETRPRRSVGWWLKFLFWTLVWGGGTLWLTLAIMRVFKEKAKYF